LDDKDVVRFLRYDWTNIVDLAISLVRLSDDELEAIELCGKRCLSIESASEIANVSVATMQRRWSKARKRLLKVWSGINWIEILAEHAED